MGKRGTLRNGDGVGLDNEISLLESWTVAQRDIECVRVID